MLARKGILASDPSVKDMTPARWMFEYHAAIEKDKQDAQLIAKIVKNTIVGTFGLNLLRPTDANGYPKRQEDMTEEEKESFLPLVAWVGREDLVDKVREQLDKDIDPEAVTADKHYEELVAAIDAADGDMEPIIGLDKITIPKVPRFDHDTKTHVQEYTKVDIEGDV